MVGAWHQHGRLVHVLGERAAQGAVEYALTVVALLAMVAGMAALWRAAVDGTLAELVRAAASHAFSAGGAIDISLY